MLYFRHIIVWFCSILQTKILQSQSRTVVLLRATAVFNFWMNHCYFYVFSYSLVYFNNPIKTNTMTVLSIMHFLLIKMYFDPFQNLRRLCGQMYPYCLCGDANKRAEQFPSYASPKKKGWFAVTDWYTRPDQRLKWIQTLMMVEGTLGKVACVSSSILSNLQTNKYRRNSMMQTITSTTESKAWS